MTRIISGLVGGRRIEVPKSGVRPTTDRVRESLFSALDSRIQNWNQIQVLDLFAGSGALGIEALSRGATAATFVEQDKQAAQIISRNLKDLNLSGEVVVANALNFQPANSYNLVIADPPYEVSDQQLQDLVYLIKDRIDQAGLVVVERGSKSEFSWPSGFEGLITRNYGDTAIFLSLRRDKP